MLSNDDTQQIRQGYLAVLGTPAVGQASRYLLIPRTSSQRQSKLRQARKICRLSRCGICTYVQIHTSFRSKHILFHVSYHCAVPLSCPSRDGKCVHSNQKLQFHHPTSLCAGAEVIFRWRIISEAVCTTIPCSTRHSANVASPSRYLEIA